MKQYIKFRILLAILTIVLTGLNASAVSLWVGESHKWDFSGSVLGSTYNLSVTSSGGYLSITGSGFYRNITPTQYFSGTATVTAEWDYTLYYGDTKRHQKVTLSISCNENPVHISRDKVTLSPGETHQLSYWHEYNSNPYLGVADAYFSGGNSSFSISRSGLITALKPGNGYVNLYSKVSNAANAPSCYVTVVDVEPTGASISDFSIMAGQSADLSVNVSPSNATIKSSQWYIESGDDVVRISGSRLTALNPGKAVIYCIVNGSVRSNNATLTVSEPKLTSIGTTPLNGSTENSVFIHPGVTYSHAISEGPEFNSIALTENGRKTAGSVEISDKQIKYIPTKPLSPDTEYMLSVSRNSIVNQWGSSAQSDVVLSFKTGPLEKSRVSTIPSTGSYLTKNDAVILSSHPSDATIYYTIDGNEPTKNSSIYSEPIKVDGDFTLKAFCVREGYEDSDVVSAEYYKSQNEIEECYPNDSNPLFNYSLATPYLKLSGPIEKSNNFRRISLKDVEGNSVEGETFITNNLIIFIPDQPLLNAMTYEMDIPRDAVKTANGEVFKGHTWSFTTPTLAAKVSMQGDESVLVLTEDAVLKSRGMEYLTTNIADGSFTFKEQDALSKLSTGVDDISAGYLHRFLRKGSNLSGQGLAFCGETGNASSISAIGDVKIVKTGFQTSAVIDGDNSLWMCGRNDFYQLGDGSGSTSGSFLKVAENVQDVALGNCFTLYVDSDNVLWGVGRNHRGQLGDGTTQDRKEPVKIMEDVTTVYASTTGYFAACITTDNRLLTWGDNTAGQLGRDVAGFSSTPEKTLDGVIDASLGEAHVLALNDDHELLAWGSNSHKQIAETGGNIVKPTVMADNVVMASAGPRTSLVLQFNGKVTGSGEKKHNNFGSGEGTVSGFVVDEGVAYSPLEGVNVEPSRFEVKPDNEVALVAVPLPYNADYDTVEWESDKPDIADVDERGVIRTGKCGEATVTVRMIDRFGTSKESQALIICTENPDNSGVGDIYADSQDWTVHTQNNRILVRNAQIGNTFMVYNLQGVIISQKVAEEPELTFSMSQPGVYIVRSGLKTVKVICQ